jgi:plasmid stability protein
MAAFIRETLEDSTSYVPENRIAEARATYLAVPRRLDEEVNEMKRLVISLPDDLHNRVRLWGQSHGISMAAYIRDVLEERTRRERAKPSFGAFASGYTDTAAMAGEMQYEPRSWR